MQGLKRRVSYPEEVRSLLASYLERLVRPGHTLRILDVGCGTTSELAAFQQRPARRSCHLVGLDVHGPTIDWCRGHGFHDDYLLCDATDAGRLPATDVIVATDLVEHLEKSDAVELIAAFERRASTAVVLLTPNGYIFNPFTPDNPYMEHRCGFTVPDLQSLGYACTGLGGPRRWRTAGSLPRGPKVLALPALAVLSRAMRRLPGQSFHLLATKRLVPDAAPAPTP